MVKLVETLEDFAKLVKDIQHSDRDAVIIVSGFTGEGKSVFMAWFCKMLSILNKTKFSYDKNMFYLRKELLAAIDSPKKKLPEYSAILADELISMFFKRNWFEGEQKAALELLDKCRDRHLAIIGAVPTFWELDSHLIHSKVRFWIHIPERGVAWVFQLDPNPFTVDKWHRKSNEKIFMKKKTPYSCQGFLCQINFEDLDDTEKERYLAVRNVKRKDTERQDKKVDVSYALIKAQRNKAIKLLKQSTNMSVKEIAEHLTVTAPLISMILNNKR